ncbi:hypothetical protein A79_1797 [Vibrio parahaemolyticus AQ3810]|nr:hypothetical protein A79_1797 [Vibrio parahaemolyticus AQ3810]
MRASSLLRQNSSSVPLSLGRTRPCKTTASPVCWKGRKFLRTEKTEFAHIDELLKRMCAANIH